jgi:hypothetical protein
MFSVTVPVLVMVTGFATLGDPNGVVLKVNDAGETVTVGLVLPAFTVNEIVVDAVTLPDTPLMVTVLVPKAAVALAEKVNVLDVVAGFGLNCAVTPLGKPVALNVTLPLKPFCGVIVIELVAVEVCATVTEAGFALKVNPAIASTVTANGFD